MSRETVYFVAKSVGRGGQVNFFVGEVGQHLPKGCFEVVKRGRRITRSTSRDLVMSRLASLRKEQRQR